MVEARQSPIDLASIDSQDLGDDLWTFRLLDALNSPDPEGLLDPRIEASSIAGETGFTGRHEASSCSLRRTRAAF
jgi:hypothetical protein